jgi:hypothetical protein
MKKTITTCAVAMAAIFAVFAIRVYAQEQAAKGDGEIVASAAAVAAERVFVDKDGDGVCDLAKTCPDDQVACPCDGKGCSQCPGFKDSDGDGVCDTRATCEKRTGASCMSTQARCSHRAGARNCHGAQPETGAEKNAAGDDRAAETCSGHATGRSACGRVRSGWCH